jgi:hypothetical protein
MLDINGSSKKPNMMGDDLFWFYVNDDGVLKPRYDTAPYATLTTMTNHACMRGANLGGGACAAKIMADGWEINY